MFIDTMEIEGLVVDEELGSGNINSADSHRQSIHVFICFISPVGCH